MQENAMLQFLRDHRPHFYRATLALGHDTVMAALSFGLSVYLRLGDRFSSYLNSDLVTAGVLFTGVCAMVFFFSGLYRGIWRYASMNDLVAIVRAVTLALLIFLAITFLLTRLDAVPRSSLVINWFVLIFLLGAPRMLYRVLKDRGFGHLLEAEGERVPVILIGAGDAADAFVREMTRDRRAPYSVFGIIDEKGRRVGRSIRGLSVMGDLSTLPKILRRFRLRGTPVQRLIVTKSLDREIMLGLLELAEAEGMTLARLPRLTEFKSGLAGGRLEVRPVAIEDLLGRNQASLDRKAMRRLIEGRRVLVTGAGGSIGSELARQIATFEPSRITLLDCSEYNLYTIDLELSERHPELPRDAVLCDVRERAAVERVFVQAEPELVFHAAALKQVPMVERHPDEGVLTNVLGTVNVAEACRANAVAAMVLISTDKAVNPCNVMGASKRLAESYCQALDLADRGKAEGRRSRFITVRFGNVLGSTGSVVPLFQRQLQSGGPLTVTHPEMTRYFMTTREAVQLVLQASALGVAHPAETAGGIYVLDMGEPVKILDLAHQMIRLAGLRPDKDVEIVFSGMRAGEKLSEQLFHAGEPMVATEHPSLRLANPRTVNKELLAKGIDDLVAAARHGEREPILAQLRRLVPELRAAQAESAAPSVSTSEDTTAAS